MKQNKKQDEISGKVFLMFGNRLKPLNLGGKKEKPKNKKEDKQSNTDSKKD